MIKIIQYIRLPSLVIILALVTAYYFRTDPIMMVSGKELSGHELPYPENWEFTNKFQTIKVETNPLDPHSVTTLCFIREGRLIIPSQDGHTKIWPQNVLKDNRARIKIADKIYLVRLNLIDQDAKISELEPFLVIKFPNKTPPESGEGPKNIWLFEVSPR